METEYKGYKIVGDGSFGYKNIKPIGKGSVPLELRGSYTKTPFAIKAIDNYLNTKGATSGKTERTSTG